AGSGYVRFLAFDHGIHRRLGAPLAGWRPRSVRHPAAPFPHLRLAPTTVGLSWVPARGVRGPPRLPGVVLPSSPCLADLAPEKLVTGAGFRITPGRRVFRPG